jgi:hypothetical protein
MTTTTTLPPPALLVPHFAALPDDVQAAIEALSKPFPVELVKVRPGPVARDGSAALCLPYADWWTSYLPRLNDELGPNTWSIDLHPWGADQIIACMSAFGGLIRKASTGSAKGEANGAAEAEVQAKKRVCAEAVMLGLCFYFLPKVWARGERVGKDFAFAAGEEQRAVYEMYRRAGLSAVQSQSIIIPRDELPERPVTPPPPAHTTIQHLAASRGNAPPATPTRQRAPLAAPAAERAASAAAPLRSAELASDKQLGLIATLISNRSSDAQAARTIDTLGTPLGIPDLSTLHSAAALRRAATRLTRLQASKLIDRLKTLQAPAHRAA